MHICMYLYIYIDVCMYIHGVYMYITSMYIHICVHTHDIYTDVYKHTDVYIQYATHLDSRQQSM